MVLRGAVTALVACVPAQREWPELSSIQHSLDKDSCVAQNVFTFNTLCVPASAVHVPVCVGVHGLRQAPTKTVPMFAGKSLGTKNHYNCSGIISRNKMVTECIANGISCNTSCTCVQLTECIANGISCPCVERRARTHVLMRKHIHHYQPSFPRKETVPPLFLLQSAKWHTRNASTCRGYGTLSRL
jgi:hypothetical protein